MFIAEQYLKQSVAHLFQKASIAAGVTLALLGGSAQLATAQNSWSTTYTSTISIGGVSGRPTPAAAVYNGSFVVAYTTTGGADSYGNYPIASMQCTYTSCGTALDIGYGSFTAATNGNPAVAVVNGTIYVAYITVVGPENPNGNVPDATMYITSSPNGTEGSWTTPVVVGTLSNVGIRYSPTMTAYNGNLYIGWNAITTPSVYDNEVGLCVSSTPTLSFSCSSPTDTESVSTASNYQPGLAVFNSTIYMGYVTNSNSHDVYYVTSPVSSPFSFGAVDSALAGSQSSSAPHLDVWNGYLNYDMRTNDSDDKFSQRHSSDGSSWSSWPDAHIAMAGEPDIVPGTGLAGADANYNYLFYTTNNSNAYLAIARGQ